MLIYFQYLFYTSGGYSLLWNEIIISDLRDFDIKIWLESIAN